MLSSWFGTTGEPEASQDEAKENNGELSETKQQQQLNLWNVASAIRSTVQARATDIVKSLQETDWESELNQFGKVLKEDTTTLTQTAVSVVRQPLETAEPSKPSPKEVTNNVGGVAASLSTFGKSLLVGTKEIFEQVYEGVEAEIATATKEQRQRMKSGKTRTTAVAPVHGKYSRFESEVAAMQRDSATYCDEPEDAAEYAAWLSRFSLEASKPDIDKLMAENKFMAELHSRIAPIIVSDEDFWSRYFYRLHKIQQKEEARQQLAIRAKARTEEGGEELGWDDEDEEPTQAPTSVPPEPLMEAVEAEVGVAPDLAAAAATAAGEPSSAVVAGAEEGGREQQVETGGSADLDDWREDEPEAAHESGPVASAAARARLATSSRPAVPAPIDDEDELPWDDVDDGFDSASRSAQAAQPSISTVPSTTSNSSPSQVSPPEGERKPQKVASNAASDHEAWSDVSTRGEWCVVTPGSESASALFSPHADEVDVSFTSG